jgi:hypothetical protein
MLCRAAPSDRLALIAITSALLFAGGYGAYVFQSVSGAELGPGAWGILLAKTSVELLASAFGIAFLVSALAYLRMADPVPPRASRGSSLPAVGIIYLCCDDADGDALESLACVSYRGPLYLIIHDDSRDERMRDAIDRMAVYLARRREWDVRVLRRPDRSGGKAGAVNYALERTAGLFEYFLLCDNDSTVLHADTIQHALVYMDSSTIGGVQFRSVPVVNPQSCDTNRRLAESIGAFHAFPCASGALWLDAVHRPQRTSADGAVQQVGGLTPDFFSDDLDLTVRLNLPVSVSPMRQRSRWARSIRPATRPFASAATSGRTAASRRCGRIGGASSPSAVLTGREAVVLSVRGFYCLQSSAARRISASR